MIPSPWLGFLREILLANHLASTDNLARTTKRHNTYQHKLMLTQKSVPNKQHYTHKNLRYIYNDTARSGQLSDKALILWALAINVYFGSNC